MSTPAPQPFKALTSFAYVRTPIYASFLEELHAGPAQVFGDSGAQSARTLGITLAIPDYAAWCHQHDARLTLYANPDLIGAPEATWRNQKKLEACGLESIPPTTNLRRASDGVRTLQQEARA
nr:hypothetical protein [Streptomyces chartreusis]